MVPEVPVGGTGPDRFHRVSLVVWSSAELPADLRRGDASVPVSFSLGTEFSYSFEFPPPLLFLSV